MTAQPPIGASISSAADVAAFMAVDSLLTRFEWRDAEGRLVARPLAVTLSLGKGQLTHAIEIRVPADNFLAVLGWEQVMA